jgi:hypothetical protein
MKISKNSSGLVLLFLGDFKNFMGHDLKTPTLGEKLRFSTMVSITF